MSKNVSAEQQITTDKLHCFTCPSAAVGDFLYLPLSELSMVSLDRLTRERIPTVIRLGYHVNTPTPYVIMSKTHPMLA